MEKLRKQLDISIPAKSAVDFALKVVADKVLKERKKREKKSQLKEGQKTGFWEKSEFDLLHDAVILFGADLTKVTAHVGTRTKL